MILINISPLFHHQQNHNHHIKLYTYMYIAALFKQTLWFFRIRPKIITIMCYLNAFKSYMRSRDTMAIT